MTGEKIEILVEKYRPENLNELAGNKDIVNYLKDTLKENYIPHLFFSGDAGTGKTTAAYAVAYELYGKNLKRKVLEINASLENGIDVVRTKINEFAMYQGNLSKSKVPFKLIILEEADNTSAAFQQGLRRTMEKWKDNCRFIITCNYEFKIIDPLKSRCKVCRFNHITNEEMKERLKFICTSEGINIDDQVLDVICERSYGDLRTAINSYLETFRFSKEKVTLDSIKSVKDEFSFLESIILSALNGKFLDAREKSFSAIQSGMDIKTFLKRLHITYINSKKYPEAMKGEFSELNETAEYNMNHGCTEDTVLSALISKIRKVGKKFKPSSKKKKV
jgi:replication factor C small subunit